MKRHKVPGTGDWFEARDLDWFTSDHQDEYTAAIVECRVAKQDAERERLIAAHPGMIPDPDQDIPVRLTQADLRPVRDLVLSWVVTASSFPLPLEFPMGLAAWNVLKKALEPFYSALNGVVPEDPTPEVPPAISGSTSGDTADAPPPEPATESSATPAG